MYLVRYGVGCRYYCAFDVKLQFQPGAQNPQGLGARGRFLMEIEAKRLLGDADLLSNPRYCTTVAAYSGSEFHG